MSSTNSSSTSDVAKDDCSICLQSLTIDPPLLTLSCGHKFHLQCLALNVKAQNKECPLCRSTVESTLSQLLSGFNNNSQQQQQIPLYSPSLARLNNMGIFQSAGPVENVNNRIHSSPSKISFH
jgi:hypothetical protein